LHIFEDIPLHKIWGILRW